MTIFPPSGQHESTKTIIFCIRIINFRNHIFSQRCQGICSNPFITIFFLFLCSFTNIILLNKLLDDLIQNLIFFSICLKRGIFIFFFFPEIDKCIFIKDVKRRWMFGSLSYLVDQTGKLVSEICLT